MKRREKVIEEKNNWEKRTKGRRRETRNGGKTGRREGGNVGEREGGRGTSLNDASHLDSPP